MIAYKISHTKPNLQFIPLVANFPTHGQEKTQLQLPAWRPGRYELGNFAKNIRNWEVTDQDGTPLPFQKLSKDLWEVETHGADHLLLSYSYYATELNAGSTFMDHDLLYFNPVNCFFYDPNFPETGFALEIDIPSSWKIATGLPKNGDKWIAQDMQQMMDSPVLCCPDLKRLSFEVEGVNHHIEWYGETSLDHEKWKADFKAYTESQVKAFGSIPCKDYHYLILFHPYRAYHGVEHSNSTVISIGPGQNMHERAVYLDLLGVCCHELYHTWNIKNIRPQEMMPYDFSKENYSELGFVAEGVTTYYGDQYLHRSGVTSDEEYYAELAKLIQRHRDNEGRFNYSVAESSWDTWLDGYVAGAPGRKVSIYVEGALIALVCDLRIIENTQGSKSLDDALRILYERFGQKGKGYTETDYKAVLEEVGSCSFDDIFAQMVHGRGDYGPFFEEAIKSVGLEIDIVPNTQISAQLYGFKWLETNGSFKVSHLASGSPAEQAGLSLGDEIIRIGTSAPTLELLGAMKEVVNLTLSRRHQLHEFKMESTNQHYFPIYQVKKNLKASSEQAKKYDFWKNR